MINFSECVLCAHCRLDVGLALTNEKYPYTCQINPNGLISAQWNDGCFGFTSCFGEEDKDDN